jgi:hypothetical protein
MYRLYVAADPTQLLSVRSGAAPRWIVCPGHIVFDPGRSVETGTSLEVALADWTVTALGPLAPRSL